MIKFHKLFLILFVSTHWLVLISCSDRQHDLEAAVRQIDLSNDSVLGIPLNLNYSDLSALHFDTQFNKIKLEGDYYDVAQVIISQNIEFQIIFDGNSSDYNSKLYYLETTSNFVKDPHGIRIGSTLRDVKNSWPNGRFIYGLADGKFARYVTGTHIIFSFNPDEIMESCFTSTKFCDDPLDLPVRQINIYSKPVPVP